MFPFADLILSLLLPPLTLTGGLPSHEQCERNCQLARAVYDMEDEAEKPLRAAIGGWFGGRAMAQWARLEVWNRARTATNDSLPWAERRLALRELVDLVGWRAVVTGELPPPLE